MRKTQPRTANSDVFGKIESLLCHFRCFSAVFWQGDLQKGFQRQVELVTVEPIFFFFLEEAYDRTQAAQLTLRTAQALLKSPWQSKRAVAFVLHETIGDIHCQS